nr:protein DETOXIFICATION 29-like [Ipomoea batatas]
MSSAYSFHADAGDIQQIKKVTEFIREFHSESKKLWYLAAPAIFTIVSQYSIGAITQVFAGHVGNIQLAAVAVENNLIAGFAFGIMNPQISKAAGKFALWMIPQLFAYVFTFPIQRFLQSQSKIYVMASVSGVALVGHVLFSWLFMLKLRWGLPGGAVVLNTTWWFMAVAQFVYVLSGACGDAWKGFSHRAFGNLTGFVRLSLASGVMFCLEMWYFVALILIAGYTKNAEVSVDAISICMNISGWTLMFGVGFSAAISVRVSNELGAGHPRTAKFSVVVATATSLFTGIILGLIPILLRSRYPPLFSKSSSVQKLVYDLTPLLGFTITLNSLQPTLSGLHTILLSSDLLLSPNNLRKNCNLHPSIICQLSMSLLNY